MIISVDDRADFTQFENHIFNVVFNHTTVCVKALEHSVDDLLFRCTLFKTAQYHAYAFVSPDEPVKLRRRGRDKKSVSIHRMDDKIRI